MAKLIGLYFVFIVTLLSSHVVAHPKLHSPADLIRRAEFQNKARRSLAGCSSKLRARDGVVDRAINRRQTLAERARRELGLLTDVPFLKKRDFGTVLNTSHHSDLTGLDSDTDPSVLFDGNTSCVLGPETTEGPYLVNGELIREDVRDNQEGVILYTDIQLIDVNTCEPASGIYLDFWHANATGVYSGVVANGNGAGSEDASNINSTAFRGIQQTSDEGFAQFVTVFPGHYTGRATHIHIMAHQTDGSLNDNDTYTGGTVSHVGQLFLDQDLISSVETISPYTTNSQTLTTNSEDGIFSDEAVNIDPVMEYVLLGDNIGDGILAWVSFGINTTVSHTVSAAATWTADGGVSNGNSSGPGGPPPPSS